MRRDHDVVAPEQRVLGQRLGWEDVERGARGLPGVERRLQGRQVHELAAGAVHEPHPLAHLRKRLGVDPVHRLRRLRQVDRHEVGPAVELIGRLDSLHAELAKALRRHELVVGEHLHLEALRPLRHELPDAPEADHAERLAVQLGAGETRARPLAAGE